MTMENDLVERLRAQAKLHDDEEFWHGNHENGDCEPHWSIQRENAQASVTCAEAAARIQALEAELAHYKSMHGVNIRTGRKLVMRERARAERAEAELARKTEALRPFARACRDVDRGGPDNAGFIGAGLVLADLRAARSALQEKTDV